VLIHVPLRERLLGASMAVAEIHQPGPVYSFAKSR
jgi:hypothetical protein